MTKDKCEKINKEVNSIAHSKNYVPNPTDVSGIEIPEDLKILSEAIAEEVHETWAQNRIKEGWTYGKERNDEEKTHPCLVPYCELSDSEKEYDRLTSQKVLKLIMKFGFDISKKRNRVNDPKEEARILEKLRKTIIPEDLYQRLNLHISELMNQYLPKDIAKGDDGKSLNKLPSGVTLELPDIIVSQFRLIIEDEYSYKEYVDILKEKLSTSTLGLEEYEIERLTKKLKNELEERAKHYSGIKNPDFKLKGLREKYEDAQRITLREHLMQDNNKDVEDFVESLKTYCMELCEVELSLALSRFYNDVAATL